MTDTVRIKTEELEGRALDWAVAVALGWKLVTVPEDVNGDYGGQVLAPPEVGASGFQFPPKGSVPITYFIRPWHRDWSQLGPLVDKYITALQEQRDGECWANVGHGRERRSGFGPNKRVAACRAIAAAYHGDYADVPRELVEKER